MKSTALGAENIIFISDAHEKFYYEKLQEVHFKDAVSKGKNRERAREQQKDRGQSL